jgi:hypothetical protein
MINALGIAVMMGRYLVERAVLSIVDSMMKGVRKGDPCKIP